MFKHLLVPLDGSKLAETILPLAQCFATHTGARVTLLHVVEADAPATVHGDTHLLNADDAEKYLAQIARQFDALEIKVGTHVDRTVGREAAKAIFAHTAELNADMILLTGHGRGGLREQVFGSIAQQVLQSEKIPVLMMRVESPRPSSEYCISKIVTPLDGGARHEIAFDFSAELAKAFQASLHLVTIVPTANTLTPEQAATAALLPSSTRAMLDLAEKGAADYLQEKMNVLKARGVSASAEVERGDVVAKIVGTVERVSANLLVMATHGRAGLDAFWSGSVTSKVLSRVNVPALLLRVAE